MHESELRFRQIHMDFHTSEGIMGIGAQFDPDEFADTLAKAAVDSVTVFARGHHGWVYYDSKRNPERIHPNLAYKHLVRDQINACHKRGIRAPIYITIQWDLLTCREHPEWICVGPEGQRDGTPPYMPGFYSRLCVNSPYRDFLRDHVTEVFEMLPVDGLFLDIVQTVDCSCQYCLADMKAQGIDASDSVARNAFAARMLDEWKHEMSAHIRSFDKDATIFYNAGHISPDNRSSAKAYSHWELESLPAGGWGYMHFPVTQRYARNLGIDSMGMTGKFHTSWGDFHSFKNQPALEFECLQMIALNAKCSIGDQLLPHGKICEHTYDLIGSVYKQVEAKEPWCRMATPVVDIGVITPEEFKISEGFEGLPQTSIGLTRMLQELGHQFDFIDTQMSLNKYKVVILPDRIPVSKAFAAKLSKFIAGGGKLIASHRSGLNEAGDAFALAELGVELVGDAPFSPNFIMPKGMIGEGLARTEHVIYNRAMEVKPFKGAKVLAFVNEPYFNRTWQHFCSHRHTPSAGKKGIAAIVQNDACIYFAHPIFFEYAKMGTPWAKTLLSNALDALLPDPLLVHDGPSTMVTAINEQKAEKRWALHVLHYIPERRADFDIIEDIIPLYDVSFSMRAPKGLKSVRCVPSGEALDFEVKDGRVTFTLPVLDANEVIELAY
jgi:hypothetical protein